MATFTGTVTLPRLIVEGKEAEIDTIGAVTLPRLRVVGRLGHPNTFLGAIKLPLLKPRSALMNRPSVQPLTSNTLRASGGSILAFKGPQNRAVEWVIVVGAGTLTPLSNRTDAQGQALCRYEASGYVGPLTVRCKFGT